MGFFLTDIQTVIIDFNSLLLIHYINGELKKIWQIPSINQANETIISYCNKNLSKDSCIILLGSPEETKNIQNFLSRYYNICCYDIKKISTHNKNTNQQIYSNEILNSLNEIKTLLKKEQSKNANTVFSSPSLPQYDNKDIKGLKSYLEESLETINKKQTEVQYLVSEIYNRSSETSNTNSSEIIEDLRKELLAYKNDFYQKSMLKFGVNTAIEILERLYIEKNLLKQKENANEELNRITQIITFCETIIKKLNLKVIYSSEGEEFDGNRMVTYDDKVYTNNENLKGRVAYSISPAIYWTLPRVNDPGKDELLIKEEAVTLYE